MVFAEVDASARVRADKLSELITPETSLISIMHVNNETGAVNDIKSLCETAKKINPNVIFHSDGVQAVGKIKVNLCDLGVDLYSVSGHKLHSPRGVGALYVKNGINLKPIIFGGGQEFNVRSSTENLAAIAAFDYALQRTHKSFDENYSKAAQLNEHLRSELLSCGDRYKIISAGECSPYILNFAMKFVRGEVMLHSLEKYDIFVGTGSACSSKKAEKSASDLFKLSDEYKKGVLRISLSPKTTLNEIDTFILRLNLEYNKLEKYMRG